MYQCGKEFWENGIIKKKKFKKNKKQKKKQVREMTYMIQGQRWEYKKYLNKIKQRFTDLVSLWKEVHMEIL